MLVGVYTLGFVLPFLAVGMFTGTVLDFFRRKRNVVRYTVKIGAVLLILMGIMTLTGYMNGITSYLSRISFGGTGAAQTEETLEEETASEEAVSGSEETVSQSGEVGEQEAVSQEAQTQEEAEKEKSFLRRILR